MGSFSLMHWVIVLLVVMLLFGGGRISGLMGDVAKGIKSFKKGMEDDDTPPAKSAARIETPRGPDQSAAPAPAPAPATEDHRQG